MGTIKLVPEEFMAWVKAVKAQVPHLEAIVLPEDMCDLIMEAYSLDRLDTMVEFYAPNGTEGEDVELQMLLYGVPTVFRKLPMGRSLFVIKGLKGVPWAPETDKEVSAYEDSDVLRQGKADVVPGQPTE